MAVEGFGLVGLAAPGAIKPRRDQMDLADASIVVMSEPHPCSQVLTVDRTDFSIYRRNDRQVIDLIAPAES